MPLAMLCGWQELPQWSNMENLYAKQWQWEWNFSFTDATWQGISLSSVFFIYFPHKYLLLPIEYFSSIFLLLNARQYLQKWCFDCDISFNSILFILAKAARWNHFFISPFSINSFFTHKLILCWHLLNFIDILTLLKLLSFHLPLFCYIYQQYTQLGSI